MNDGEEPPVKRFLMLPDDLVLNCLARVARFYYPILYLVSISFRSLVASTELSQTRTLYAIGGGIGSNASSSVMVMDSRSHTWLEAPSMLVPHKFPSACTLDGKVYVTGGCGNLDSTNWMEVFDTKTKTWEFLQIPSEEICGGSNYESARYEGTVYVRSEAKNVTYKLHKGRWRSADISMNRRWGFSRQAYCVIENVFYSFGGDRMIYWYDPKARVWATLKGLEGSISWPIYSDSIKLADHGGKSFSFQADHSSTFFVSSLYISETKIYRLLEHVCIWPCIT